jgi:hypothetical protein
MVQGYEEALGSKHTSTLNTVNNLGMLYANQGKLGEAEKMFMRALQGYEEALGMENVDRYIPALILGSNCPARLRPVWSVLFSRFDQI